MRIIREEHTEIGFAFAECLFGAFALGDVMEDQNNSAQSAGFIPNGGARVINGSFRPISGDDDRMVGKADYRSLPKDLLDRAFHWLACLLVADDEHLFEVFARCLRLCPAGQALRYRVEEGDLSLRVGRDHGIANTAQGRSAVRFADLQGSRLLLKRFRLAQGNPKRLLISL